MLTRKGACYILHMKENPTQNHSSTLTSTTEGSQLTHEDIARKAYELWLQDGCPMGREIYHWHEAERQLLQSPQSSAFSSQSQSSKTEERSLAALTDDSSPYNGLEKESPRSPKVARNLAKRT